MTTFNPHANVNLAQEADIMAKGRLIKARLPDQPLPNVSWFWFRLGNCWACKYFDVDAPKCLNPKITDAEFFDKYLYTTTCPQFEAGVSAPTLKNGGQNALDVMRAAGIVPGAPSQSVRILYDKPWSMEGAVRAHWESGIFLDMARAADYTARGGTNSPDRQDYVDLGDDLEGAVPPQPAPDAPPRAP